MKYPSSLWSAADRQRTLLHATFELTPRCNLSCLHCYVDHRRHSILTFDKLVSTIDELADHGTVDIAFTGGEIALRRDLFSIVAHARKRRFAVTLQTSGTLWRRNDWDRIAGLAVTAVRVSLYATVPAIHDMITGVPGSHNRTMATIRGLLARDVRVEIACPVMTANVHEVPGVVSLARRLRIPLGFDPTIRMREDGDNTPKKHCAAVHDLEALARTMKRRHVFQLPLKVRPRRRRASDAVCIVGRFSCFVRADGELLPCVNWPRSAGNIHNHSVLDLWRQSEVLRQARTLRWADLDTCLRCTANSHCTPCPGLNLDENSTLGLPSAGNCAWPKLLHALDSG